MAIYIIFLVALCAGMVGCISEWKKRQNKEDVSIEEYRSLNKQDLSTTIILFIILAYHFIDKLVK